MLEMKVCYPTSLKNIRHGVLSYILVVNLNYSLNQRNYFVNKEKKYSIIAISTKSALRFRMINGKFVGQKW